MPMVLEIMIQTIAVVACTVLVVVIGFLTLIVKCYLKPSQGQVIIRNGLGGTHISFEGIIAVPIIHKAECLDVTLKRLVIDRQGTESLTCQDGTRVDVTAAFFVRIKPETSEVTRVVRSLGIEKASDISVLYGLFKARFSEALKAVARRCDFDQLDDREYFKTEVMKELDVDLDGYVLEVVTIEHLAKSQS